MCSAALLVSTIGCANGPIRQWMQGAPCNTCNPQIQQPINVAPPCNSGCAENAVGTGILGRLFNGNRNQSQIATCGSGGCSVAPTSMPASNFAASETPIGTSIHPSASNTLPLVVDSDPAVAPPATELYGNTNTVGRLEMPPLSFSKN